MNSNEASEKAGLKSSDLEMLCNVAREATLKGGEVLKKYFGNLDMIRNKGRCGDLVTNADLESEEVVLKFLKEKTPQIGLIAEESGDNASQNKLVWCVDPLDGTTNFAHGYPFFGTSVGLLWEDIPVLGAISVPFLNENYWAAPTLGAFLNGSKISVSTCRKLEDSLLVTGFAYDRHDRLDNNYAEFAWLTHRCHGVRRGGAAAVDLAFVAVGRLDGYWERGLSKWDLAAGVALVEQAGGSIRDYKDRVFDITNGRILASTPGIEKELITELNKVKPLTGEMFGAPEITSLGT